jgi:hypothetical protein
VHDLYQQDFFEIATLAAPTVRLQIVLPTSRLPVFNVQVEVVAEQQCTSTNEQGECCLVLRSGPHMLRMQHATLTSGWVEQRIEVVSMEPHFQVPLPMKLRVWEAPTAVRGEVCCADLWITASINQRREGWQPFSGELQASEGQLFVEDGVVDVECGLAMVLDEHTTLHPPIADPLASVLPLKPFSQCLEGGIDVAYKHGPPSLSAHLEQGPFHIGTALSTSPAGGPRSILVRSMSACCGCAVGGLQIRVNKGSRSGCTNKDGAWLVTGLEPGEQQLELSHP